MRAIVKMRFKPFKDQFLQLYADGIRALPLVHNEYSRFAGYATHHNFLGNGFGRNGESGGGYYQIKSDFSSGVEDRYVSNAEGLKEDGYDLLDLMCERGMLVDVAHLSARAKAEVISYLVTEWDNYPWIDTHTRPYATASHNMRTILGEFSTDDHTLNLFKHWKSLLGLRLAESTTLPGSVKNSPVADDCAGSSKSFAQMLQYVYNFNVPVAVGSDWQGNGKMLNPRFAGHPGGTKEMYIVEPDGYAFAACNAISKHGNLLSEQAISTGEFCNKHQAEPKWGYGGLLSSVTEISDADPFIKELYLAGYMDALVEGVDFGCKCERQALNVPGELRCSQLQAMAQSTPTGTEFDFKGLAKIDLMIPFFDDLRNLGAQPEKLEDSSMQLYDVWHRASQIKGFRPMPAAANIGKDFYMSQVASRFDPAADP